MNFIIINTICTVLLLFVSVATILAEDTGYKGFKRGTALITARELKKMLDLKTAHSSQLWDARDRKEYCGEELKKGAVRAGRIPWGIHSPWLQFKKKENQAEWLSAAEVKGVIEKLGYDSAKEQYFFCQSGVRSTQAIFALYLSGWPLERLHNYDSSWIGWSRDQRLPINSGCSENVASEVSLTNK